MKSENLSTDVSYRYEMFMKSAPGSPGKVLEDGLCLVAVS